MTHDKPEVQALIDVRVERTVGDRWAVRLTDNGVRRSVAICYDEDNANLIASILESLRSTNTSEADLEAQALARLILRDDELPATRRSSYERESVLSICRALLKAAATNTDWVSVPREPTEEMLTAAIKHSHDFATKELRPMQPLTEDTWREACVGRYKAMLAAAPHLTAQPKEQK